MTQTQCPKCAATIEVGHGKTPVSEHTAIYYSCPKCPWFAVERTPEHEEALKPKK